MVTTNSLKPHLRIKMAELEQSDLPEERELFAQASKIIAALMAEIMPIIKYIDAEISTHQVYGLEKKATFKKLYGIRVGADAWHSLVLSRDGKWYRLVERSTSEDTLSGANELPDEWKNFYFTSVVERLKQAVDDAVKTKETHLTALRIRQEVLGRLVEVLQAR